MHSYAESVIVSVTILMIVKTTTTIGYCINSIYMESSYETQTTSIYCLEDNNGDHYHNHNYKKCPIYKKEREIMMKRTLQKKGRKVVLEIWKRDTLA